MYSVRVITIKRDKIGQSDIIELLKEKKIPMTRKEIASSLDEDANKISVLIGKLLDQGELLFDEIDRKTAYTKYNSKRRMRIYRLSDFS